MVEKWMVDEFGTHLQDVVQKALDRGVSCRFNGFKPKAFEDMDWLEGIGFKVFTGFFDRESKEFEVSGKMPNKSISKDTYDDVDDLVLIDCRIISFFESSFEAAGFNQVIRNWIGGKYEKLEVLIFWVDEPVTNPEEVSADIQTSVVGNVSMQTILDNIKASVKVQRADDGLFHFRMVVLKSDEHVPQFDISETTLFSNEWPIKVDDNY
ncbi:hypothetical protein CAEBREN_16730 [Caenorhabditis brenneri]|uniref:Sdz-33 F-box domain-containing protein n=1 Tax=Caenorhabditis brenneri TaxID=135651 RepID=G0N2Q4_CAEBE|nr:hypothetical protein CAEBREN_16730 [Caenorhabditis brenneri]